MVKIIDKMKALSGSSAQEKSPFFSFEFFPPKTEEGKENLYLRMDRMTALEPLFIDITWGAGGSTKDLTMAISAYSQRFFGAEVMMHLTCTGLTRSQIKVYLQEAREMGISNILALRGDPSKGAVEWSPVKDGCDHAADLVRLIREEHGDYFGIAVAGFPEGHPAAGKDCEQQELQYLKAKVDAGADFILTQFFYDTSVFIDFVTRARQAGIKCPIVPGMMPIQSYSSFQRMTSFCGTKVPDRVWEDLMPFRDDDEAVKEYGIRLSKSMCKELLAAGVMGNGMGAELNVHGFHFYTLNLENSVLSVLADLGAKDSTASRRTLPWRGSRSNLQTGKEEDVRPINWANRPKSYIQVSSLFSCYSYFTVQPIITCANITCTHNPFVG
jgi:methylenetetrahydrofolate reductase (NADPH)